MTDQTISTNQESTDHEEVIQNTDSLISVEESNQLINKADCTLSNTDQSSESSNPSDIEEDSDDTCELAKQLAPGLSNFINSLLVLSEEYPAEQSTEQ